MTRLTKIEILDAQYPGLADDVRKWFAQGIAATRIVQFLAEKYRVSMSATPIARFRSRRWVPEQRLLQEKRAAVRAAEDVAREREVKASLAVQVPGEGK